MVSSEKPKGKLPPLLLLSCYFLFAIRPLRYPPFTIRHTHFGPCEGGSDLM